MKAFASGLTAAQPARKVRTVEFSGAHMMQLHMDPRKYADAVLSLLVEAGLPESAM